jgi:hypothetical protein
MTRPRGLYLATWIVALTAILSGSLYFLPLDESLHDAIAGHGYHREAWQEVKPAYGANRLQLLLHVGPGVLWLVLALLQVRGRPNLAVHRWRGRAAILLGLTSMAGVIWLNLINGVSYGGALERATVAVFAILFISSTMTAYVAIRRGDCDRHRRFMLRALAYGASVGIIRLFWYPLVRLDLFMQPVATRHFVFGVVFAVAMATGAAVIELYLRRRPIAT